MTQGNPSGIVSLAGSLQPLQERFNRNNVSLDPTLNRVAASRQMILVRHALMSNVM